MSFQSVPILIGARKISTLIASTNSKVRSFGLQTTQTSGRRAAVITSCRGISFCLDVAACRSALFQITLVVFLGTPECARRRDFRGDGSAQFAARLERLLGLFRRGFLLRRMEKDRRAVLLAVIGALPVHLRGIVNGPENIQQLLVAELRRIKRDLHGFGVASSVRADVALSGILCVTA